jgi:hypothetical protein
MPSSYEVSGPAALVLVSRDPQASAEFYERRLDFRDPQQFPNGAIGFLTYPIPLGLVPPRAGAELNGEQRPGLE